MDYNLTWTEQQQNLVYEMYDDEVVIKVRVDDTELEKLKVKGSEVKLKKEEQNLIEEYDIDMALLEEANKWLGRRQHKWAHAFAIVDYFDRGLFTVHIIQIIKGKCSLCGELIDGNI